MNRLTRYLVSELLKIFSICLAALVSIYLTIDSIEKIRVFITHHASISHILTYFLLKLPGIIFEISPIAILLATFLTLGLISRRNELTAFKTGGIHIARIVMPFLVFGLLGSLTMLFLNLSIIPSLNREAKFVRKVLIEKKNPDVFFKQGKLWFKQNNNTIYNIQLIEPGKNQFLGITVYQLGNDFQLLDEIDAKELRYENGDWLLIDGIHRHFLMDGNIDFRSFQQEPINLNKTPKEFRHVNLRHQEMTFPELSSYVSRLKKEGYSSTKYAVDLHRKFAFPFSSFIMVVLAIPFALREGVRTHLTKGIGLSILIGMTYWILFSFILSLGHGGVLPPLISAWLSNFLFFGLGAFLFMKLGQ